MGAKRSIIENSVMDSITQVYLRGWQYEREKKKSTDNLLQNCPNGQNVHSVNTAEKLAEIHKVDERTIRRDGDFANAVDTIADTLRKAGGNNLAIRSKTAFLNTKFSPI